jgi:hypothetical protein
MNRQSIPGGWIDLDTAKKFVEDRNWDGHNHISVNTGSQWDHEVLYRSVGGVYVLHTWSQYQGTQDTWERIGIHNAVAWLVRNDYQPTTPEEESIVAGLEV